MNGALLTLRGLQLLLAGAVVGGGVALLVASLVGWPRRARSGPSGGARLAAFMRRRGAAAILAAVVVLVLTRWPVLAVAAAALTLFWTKLFGGAKEERTALERVEGLATWTESLRDTVAASSGLEDAIRSTAGTAPPALQQHLTTLVNQLHAKTRLTIALDLLAENMDDGSTDMVIIALKQNAAQRGPGLREALSGLTVTARDEADMRRRILAQRAGTRRSVKIVLTICAAFPVGMALFNPSYVEAYSTVRGQGVLLVVLAFFAGGLMWLRKLSAVQPPARLLVRARTGGA
ncbi:type II secretion system F family protein [Kitasatospora sp. NPDC001540]|uniref:type II secretion system F family protein n=1 Tax=Kitasatospora sp. NPDC001540 TaxID=3364014 RepID=UPI00368A553B